MDTTNHCQVVLESINGERFFDEQTFASLTILSERLDRLKGMSAGFDEISFSPVITKLLRQKNELAVS